MASLRPYLNLETELEAAVLKNDLERVKELTWTGARVNMTTARDHTNLLITAIKNGTTAEIVRELLKHKAWVNATDKKDNTAINLAAKKNCDYLEVIKVLLEYGADVNLRNREERGYEYHHSALDNAMKMSIAYSQWMIKMVVLRNYDKKYGNSTIDLSLWRKKNIAAYEMFSEYERKCRAEFAKMQMVKLSGICLCEVMLSEEARKKVSWFPSDEEIQTSYLAYQNAIFLTKDRWEAERASVMRKLECTKIYAWSEARGENGEQEKVFLNFDLVCVLAKLLNYNDLENLTRAYTWLKRDAQSAGLDE